MAMTEHQRNAHVKQYMSARIPRQRSFQVLQKDAAVLSKDTGGKKKGSSRSGRRTSATQLERNEVARLGEGAMPEHCQKEEDVVRYFENDENFVVEKLVAAHRRCFGCGIDFLHNFVIPPDDIVITHKERFEFPDKTLGWSKHHLSHHATRAIPYHCRVSCLMKRRFRKQYLASSNLHVPITMHLNDCHKTHLESVKKMFK